MDFVTTGFVIQETGIFRDVLETHRDCLRRCIFAAGGWKQAFLDLTKPEQILPVDADVSYWPVEMRCKLLEHIRQEHMSGKYVTSLPPATPVVPVSSSLSSLSAAPGEFEMVDHVSTLLQNERDVNSKTSRQLEVSST